MMQIQNVAPRKRRTIRERFFEVFCLKSSPSDVKVGRGVRTYIGLYNYPFRQRIANMPTVNVDNVQWHE